jgi:putative pyruvate formate lyase activating enzyme
MITKLHNCTLCPRACAVDRRRARGFCGGGMAAAIGLAQLHHWEEPVISGSKGSGALFFSGCSMRCAYCQNHEISRHCRGKEYDSESMAGLMLGLQSRGAHNINLVTAGHFTVQVASALGLARREGLILPVVWNSNAYELPETLRLLEGLINIYLPDFRYWNDATAVKYSSAPGYPETARRAILEMHRQAGRIEVSEGLALRGLLVRILVLPGHVEEAESILGWIADTLGPETHVSLMGQYYPAHEAERFPEINRSLHPDEYERCLEALDRLGLENGFVQEVGSSARYTPGFLREG